MMKRLIGAFLILLLSFPVLSQDEDDMSLFEDLEEEQKKEEKKERIKKETKNEGNGKDSAKFSTETKEEGPSFGKKWWEASDLSIKLKSYAFYQTATPRSGLHDSAVLSNGSLDYKFNKNVNDWFFSTNMILQYGTEEHSYRGTTKFMQDRENYRRIFEFNEGFFTYSLKKVDLVVGKKIYKIGVGQNYSPSNRINPVDLNDPSDGREIGIWSLGSEIFIGDSSLNFYVFPFYSISKSSSPHSRWSGTGDSYNEQEEGALSISSVSDGNLTYITPKFRLNNTRFLLHFKTVLWGWDFFASTFHGLSRFPVLKANENITTGSNTNTFIGEFVPVFNGSFGGTTTSGAFKFYTEGVYQYSYAKRDDEYLAFVVGGSYAMDEVVKVIGFDKIEINVEYAGEAHMQEQVHGSYLRSSVDSRRAPNNVIGKLIFSVNDNLHFFSAFNFDLDNGGRATGLGGDYAVTKKAKVTLLSEFYYGKRDTYYGTFRENSRIVGQFKYTFK